MKTDELRTIDFKELKPCDNCGGPHKVDFYVLEISQAIINRRTIQQLAGLTLQLGGADALADVFMPTREGAKLLPAKRIILCQECFMMKAHNLALLWEEGESGEESE